MAGRASDYGQIGGSLLSEHAGARLDSAFSQIFFNAFTTTYTRKVAQNAAVSATLTRKVAQFALLSGAGTRQVAQKAVLLKTTERQVAQNAAVQSSGNERQVAQNAVLSQSGNQRQVAQQVRLDGFNVRQVSQFAALGTTNTRQVAQNAALLQTTERQVAQDAAVGTTNTRQVAQEATLASSFTRQVAQNATVLRTNTRQVAQKMYGSGTFTRQVAQQAKLAAAQNISPAGIKSWEAVCVYKENFFVTRLSAPIPACPLVTSGVAGTTTTWTTQYNYNVLGIYFGYNPFYGYLGVPAFYNPYSYYLYGYGYSFTAPYLNTSYMYYYTYGYGYYVPYVFLTSTGYSPVYYWSYPTTTQNAPTVNAVVPNNVPTSGGVDVQVYGTGLSNVTKVMVAGVQVPFVYSSASQTIHFTSPVHGVGVVNVQLIDNLGQYSQATSCTTLTFGLQNIDLRLPVTVASPDPVAIPAAPSGPGAIYSPTPNSNISGTVTFTWEPVANTYFYYISIGRASNGGDYSIANTYSYSTSITLTGIPTDGPIYVKVRASQTIPNAITPGLITAYNDIPVPVVVTPTHGDGFGIPSRAVVGTPRTLETHGFVIAPDGIPTSEVVGTVGMGPIQIGPAGIPSAEAFGTNIGVNKQPIRVDLGIRSKASVGIPVVFRPLAQIDQIVPNAFDPVGDAPTIHFEILGAYFSGTTSVLITDMQGSAVRTIPAADCVVIIDGAIILNTPMLPAGQYHVIVITVNGQPQPQSSDTFWVEGVPTVTAVTPSTGTHDEQVTITGTNFGNATVVKFGATTCDHFLVIDQTHITALVPAGSGTVDVTVKTSVDTGTTSATSSADHFTYGNVPPGIPTKEAFGTAKVSVTIHPAGWIDELFGMAGVALRIAPSGWQEEAFGTPTVRPPGVYPFGIGTGAHFGLAVITTTASILPSGWLDEAFGNDTVSVPQFINLDTAHDGVTTGEAFGAAVVAQPAPAVTSLSYAPETHTPIAVQTAGGDVITVHGNFLGDTTSVHIDGISVSFTQVDDSTLHVTTAAHASGTVDLTVTTPNGTSPLSSADHLTFGVFPTLTAYSSYLGPPEGASVVLTGTDLNATGTVLTFNGVTLVPGIDYNIDSSTQITVFNLNYAEILPTSAAQSGSFQVVSDDGFSTSAPTYTFLPSVTSVSPTSGSVGGGSLVDIFGYFFEAGTTVVHFNGNDQFTVTFISTTHIRAAAPAHAAGVTDTGVTTSVGTSIATTADHFTYTIIPTQTINLDTAHNGIPSTVAFGTAIVQQPTHAFIFPVAIMDEAFGHPSLPTINLNDPTHRGIQSIEFFGHPTVKLVRQVIFFLGLTSKEAFGRPHISNVNQTIAPVGFVDSRVGVPGIRRQITIAPAGIPPPD